MKLIYIYVILGMGFLTSCNEEDHITPNPGEEMTYQLPQGDQEYDDEIVSWFEKYGFYTLYKFEKKDLYWNNASWTEGHMDGKGMGAVIGRPTDPGYVRKQLDLLKESFMELYPDTLLERCMPFKLLLCSELWKPTSKTIYYPKYEILKDSVKVWAYTGFDLLAVNGGSAEIDTMSRVTKVDFQKSLNLVFLTYLNTKGWLKLSEEFTSVSDYMYDATLMGVKLYTKGYIRYLTAEKGNVPKSKANDFEAYLKLITIPQELLESEKAGTDGDSYTPSLIGCLHPSRDVNGLVRKKYEILMKYFREEYGIDTERFRSPKFR